jgi:hypothetical protein
MGGWCFCKKFSSLKCQYHLWSKADEMSLLTPTLTLPQWERKL